MMSCNLTSCLLQENGIMHSETPQMFRWSPQNQCIWSHRSGQGIRPDNKKIEAISNAPRSKCASEVRSFLRLTNYCARPDYSSITYPLHQLTKSTSTFHWRKEQEQSFKQLKQALASPQVLAHYSLTAPTRLVVDSSPWALLTTDYRQNEEKITD